MAVGYAANNILPLRGGEILRAHTLYRQFGVGHTAGLANVFLERVLDGVMLTIFLILGVAASFVGMGGMEYAGDVLLAAMAFLVLGVSIAVGALYAIARHPARAEEILVRRLRRVPILRRHDATWVSGLIEGVRPAGDRALLTAAFFASAAAWGMEALMYFLVGEAFDLDLPLPVYLLVAAAANVIISAPSTSGGVGPFEWAAKEVVLIYLVGAHAQESAIAYAAALHGLVLVPITLLGLAFLWNYHLPVRRLLRGGATSEEAEAGGRQGSALTGEAASASGGAMPGRRLPRDVLLDGAPDQDAGTHALGRGRRAQFRQVVRTEADRNDGAEGLLDPERHFVSEIGGPRLLVVGHICMLSHPAGGCLAGGELDDLDVVAVGVGHGGDEAAPGLGLGLTHEYDALGGEAAPLGAHVVDEEVDLHAGGVGAGATDRRVIEDADVRPGDLEDGVVRPHPERQAQHVAVEAGQGRRLLGADHEGQFVDVHRFVATPCAAPSYRPLRANRGTPGRPR